MRACTVASHEWAPAPRSGTPPDGYTVLLANAGIATGATAYVKLAFNALRDFAPVTQVSATPHILVTHPSLPPKSVKELIAFTRTRPGELNFSSTGHGKRVFPWRRVDARRRAGISHHRDRLRLRFLRGGEHPDHL